MSPQPSFCSWDGRFHTKTTFPATRQLVLLVPPAELFDRRLFVSSFERGLPPGTRWKVPNPRLKIVSTKQKISETSPHGLHRPRPHLLPRTCRRQGPATERSPEGPSLLRCPACILSVNRCHPVETLPSSWRLSTPPLGNAISSTSLAHVDRPKKSVRFFLYRPFVLLPVGAEQPPGSHQR